MTEQRAVCYNTEGGNVEWSYRCALSNTQDGLAHPHADDSRAPPCLWAMNRWDRSNTTHRTLRQQRSGTLRKDGSIKFELGAETVPFAAHPARDSAQSLHDDLQWATGRTIPKASPSRDVVEEGRVSRLLPMTRCCTELSLRPVDGARCSSDGRLDCSLLPHARKECTPYKESLVTSVAFWNICLPASLLCASAA